MQKTKKILVVDDENMIRINLEAFLEDEGYVVVTVGSAEQGLLELNKANDFALAIVDLRLPGMDGSNFILSANKISPHTKFILHTGSVEYMLTPDLMQIGITEEQILFKPLIEMQILLNLLNKLLAA